MNQNNTKTNKSKYIGKGLLLSGGNVHEFTAIRNQLALRGVKWSEYLCEDNRGKYDPKTNGRYFIIAPESIKRLPRGSSSNDSVKRPYMPVSFENGHSIYKIYQDQLDLFKAVPVDTPKVTAQSYEAMKKLLLEAFAVVNNLCTAIGTNWGKKTKLERVHGKALKRFKRREREFERQWS